MWFLLLLAFQLVALVAAGFINPPDNAKNLAYQNGTIQSIKWESTLATVALVLWPNNGGGLEYLPDSSNISNTGVYPWLVQVDASNNLSNTSFFFEIYKPGDTTPEFASSYFNITVSSSITTTTTTTTATSTHTSSLSTSTQSANPTQSAVPISGLGSGAKAGIGVGVVLGVLLLIALGIFAGWRLRTRRPPGQSSGGYNAVGTDYLNGHSAIETPPEDIHRPKTDPQAPLRLHELQPQEADRPRWELEDPPQELGNGLPVELSVNTDTHE